MKLAPRHIAFGIGMASTHSVLELSSALALNDDVGELKALRSAALLVNLWDRACERFASPELAEQAEEALGDVVDAASEVTESKPRPIVPVPNSRRQAPSRRLRVAASVAAVLLILGAVQRVTRVEAASLTQPVMMPVVGDENLKVAQWMHEGGLRFYFTDREPGESEEEWQRRHDEEVRAMRSSGSGN